MLYAKVCGDVLTGFGSKSETRQQTTKKHPMPRKAARLSKPIKAEKTKFPTIAPRFPIVVRILTLVALNGIGIMSAFTAVTTLPAILDVTIIEAASVSM